MIIHRGKLQKANRLLHQTLRYKEIRILEVAIVQGRKFVCFCCRVRSGTSLEVFIHVSHSGAEHGHLLNEGLECACMSRVSGPSPILVLNEILFTLRQLFDPDVDQSLQSTRSQVGERGVLPEFECFCRSTTDVRGFQ